MLSKDERNAEQALALYATAFGAEFRIGLKLIAAADAKFAFRLQSLPFKWRQLWRRHHFCRRRRFDSLVHICDSTARLERVIYIRHQLWLFFAPFFFKVEYEPRPAFTAREVHLIAKPNCEFSQCHVGSRKCERVG